MRSMMRLSFKTTDGYLLPFVSLSTLLKANVPACKGVYPHVHVYVYAHLLEGQLAWIRMKAVKGEGGE